MSRTVLLLIAHGSRSAEANADVHHAAAELRQLGPTLVEPAFLELASPSIEEAGERCVKQGAERVVLVPYFLSAGIHVSCDLTAASERLRLLHPEIHFRLAAPLGRHPLLLEVVLDRFHEALGRET